MTSYNTFSQSELMVLLEKTREELNASETRFRNVVNRHPDGLFILDALGTVHFANPAALRLIAQPPDAFFRDFNWRMGVGKTITYNAKISGKNVVFEIQVSETEWESKLSFLVTLRDISSTFEKQVSLQQAIDDAEARTAELEIMRFVADQLNQAAMLEETIQSGLEMIQALSGAKWVWALLVDENTAPHLVVIDNQVEGKKARQSLLELPENCTCMKKMLNGELNEMIKVQSCEWMGDIFGPDCTDGGHLSFPLITGGKVIGVLNLVVEADKEYSHNDITLLETVSRELATAIERGRMLSETSDALHRDEGVNSITRTLSSTLDLTTVLQNVIKLSSNLIGAEVGLLGLLSQDRCNLTFPFHFGLPANLELPILPQKECMIWNSVVKGVSLVDHNFQGVLPELPVDISEKVNSVIVAPIIGNDRCLGVISLYKTSHDRRFTKFDLTMLESLGRQAGLAIMNAELYFEVQQLTTSDPLTGVNNRLSFNNLSVKEVERSWRYGRPLTLILVDVDLFKEFNDTYGYESGNQALRTLAKVCMSGLRRVDVLGRYQQDELLLLLPETDIKNGTDVAERLRLQVATTPVQTDKGQAAITVSMGVVGIEGRQEIDLMTLVERAEMALYDAKQGGRNRVVVWQAE